MTLKVPFSRPDITQDEIDAVTRVLRSDWLTTGPEVKSFEAAFAAEVRAKEAIAVSSCTAAMHLALEAMGVAPGDEVIVPALTFAATAEVVRYLGARPVLVDVLDGDHNIHPAAVERAISPRSKVVIPVHFAGQPCDMDALHAIARAHNLLIVEDAAHAIPASFGDKPVGSLSDITAFSFYATKPLNTGEGGMATTDNPEWAGRMRMMSLHGISHDAWKRYSASGSWYYEIVAPGFKYNMTDMAAALGNVQLRRSDAMHAARCAIAARYRQAFADSSFMSLPAVHPDRGHAWHLFVIRLRQEMLSVDRARFIEELKAAGVGASVHFIPLHLHPYYRETYGYQPGDLPVATRLYEASVSLPLFSAMTESQVDHVIDTVLSLCARFKR